MFQAMRKCSTTRGIKPCHEPCQLRNRISAGQIPSLTICARSPSRYETSSGAMRARPALANAIISLASASTLTPLARAASPSRAPGGNDHDPHPGLQSRGMASGVGAGEGSTGVEGRMSEHFGMGFDSPRAHHGELSERSARDVRALRRSLARALAVVT